MKKPFPVQSDPWKIISVVQFVLVVLKTIIVHMVVYRCKPFEAFRQNYKVRYLPAMTFISSEIQKTQDL